MSDVVIVSAKRTPIGAFQGALAPVTATQLGSAAVKAAVEAAGVKAAEIQEVIMGCVLSAGLGQGPARQAALGAGVQRYVLKGPYRAVSDSGSQSGRTCDRFVSA